MIFTRRFGALAARPNFRLLNETQQEPDVDLPSARPEAELEVQAADAEPAAVHAG